MDTEVAREADWTIRINHHLVLFIYNIMLYMITEHFKNNDPGPVGERFRARGRLIPEGSGVEYVASWMAVDGSVCFQIMEAPSRAALEGWIANWCDLVDFEVTPVLTSADFWAQRPRQ